MAKTPFKLRSQGSSFKMMGSSPLAQTKFTHNWDPNDIGDIDESKNILTRGSTSLTEKKTFGGDAINIGGNTELGSLVDESRETEDERIAREAEEKNTAANKDRKVQGSTKITNTEGDTEPPEKEKWWEKDAWQDSGAGHITEAVKSIGRGIKNIRAKKSAKKAQKLIDARTAVGSGSETLKQAKLLKKSKKRTAKTLLKKSKKEAKDKEKLAKYRIKHPVTGKEAINLATGGGSKSLEPNQ